MTTAAEPASRDGCAVGHRPVGGSKFTRDKRMDLFDAGNIVQNALDSGRIEEGRTRLDAWQALQPVTRETLRELRYYRPLLGQYAEALVAAKAMIQLQPPHEWERMCDQLRLGELYLAIGAIDDAWAALAVVLDWPALPDNYSVGLARSTVELAFDISIAASAHEALADKAFKSGVQLLDSGCSTSFNLFKKGRDCAKRLNRRKLRKRFERALIEERKRHSLLD